MMTNPRKSDILITIATEVILMSGITVINSSTEQKFRSFAKSGRILLLAAPCGFGKTTLAASLLKQLRARVQAV